ncbi:hypothetical protein PVK06_020429 [Gossypium arboreum]|uniref:Uncharacterized protein n=1 Tax=Gossypium arboreum TaxID=29729 RepID=A0ABR0PMR8_GOSAR|nr:hypothetical protein PVK06_020429 [Gossypium arboreum]
MENEFLSKVEDNASVRAWSERLQSERGDSLAEGYVSELQDFTRVNVVQNELQELRDIWASWNEGIKQLFYQNYGDVSYLLDIRVDKNLFRALVRKTYARVFSSQIFVKKLMSISGMSEPWVITRIQQKGDSKCIPWENLRDLILTHPDERKRVDIFALSIYGLVIFPKALRHVDEAVIDLFDRLEKGITLSEFSLKGAHYKKRVRELSDAWKQTCWMKRLAVGSIVTPKYSEWFRKRINDNIPRPS